MAALSVATGVALLYDEGVLPPNPARQALAFASPADATKLESDGLACRTTATDLALDEQTADGADELSPAAMQFLEQDLASPTDVLKSHSAYPYAGWASVTTAESTEAPQTAASSTAADPSIDLLA